MTKHFAAVRSMMYAEGVGGEPRATIPEEQRAVLESLLPEAVRAVAEVLRAPGRNSRERLQAAKLIFERAGLPALREIGGPGGASLLGSLDEAIREAMKK